MVSNETHSSITMRCSENMKKLFGLDEILQA
jgi:hypothetical protein